MSNLIVPIKLICNAEGFWLARGCHAGGGEISSEACVSAGAAVESLLERMGIKSRTGAMIILEARGVASTDF